MRQSRNGLALRGQPGTATGQPAAVLKSLVPIVMGHEASIAVVVGTVVIAEAYLVPDTV